MRRELIRVSDAGEVLLVDSISQLTNDDSGRIAVSGSHGGTSASEYAYRFQVKAAVFNDAGVGKDKAGIIGLSILDEHHIIGMAIDCHSGRIGDSLDVYQSGVISAVNHTAKASGISTGMAVNEAVKLCM